MMILRVLCLNFAHLDRLCHHKRSRYYHREGVWLSASERATLGSLHLCYATALLRAWSNHGSAAGAAPAEKGDDADDLAALRIKHERISAARALADALPAVAALGDHACPQSIAATAALLAAHPQILETTMEPPPTAATAEDDAELAANESPGAAAAAAVAAAAAASMEASIAAQSALASHWGTPTPPPEGLVAIQRWAAARDAATVLFLWCSNSCNTIGTTARSPRQKSKRGKGRERMRTLASEQLLGGPRRYRLLRARPDGELEAFAAVATEFEASQLHPEYNLCLTCWCYVLSDLPVRDAISSQKNFLRLQLTGFDHIPEHF